MVKPVYVFSGFLDSGKTSVIKETLSDSDFTMGDPTLIIALEEGDEEYDEEFLRKSNSKVVYLDSINDLTKEQMAEYELDYDFDRIFIELNGLENDEILYKQGFINNWDLAEALSIFNAQAYDLQINNLKTFFFDHIRFADVCIFNRADNVDKRTIRNNLKAANPRLQIIYEDSDGNATSGIEDIEFDLNSNPLYIEDADYGLWYMDALDHPLKYDGHNISLNMMLVEDLGHDNACIMCRKAMVCCANDITDIGITCVGMDTKALEKGKYYRIIGRIQVVDDTQGYKTCLLYVNEYHESSKPQEELVTFN